MLKYKIYIILFFLSSSLLNAFFEPPTLEVKPDTNNALIGEQVRVNMSITFADSINSFVFPEIEKNYGKIEVLVNSAVDSNRKGNLTTIKKSIVVTAFDSCDCEFPALMFYYEREGFSALYPLKSAPFNLTFTTVAVDTSKSIRDIHPPYFFQSEPKIWLIVIIVIVSLLICMILIYFIRKYLQKRRINLLKQEILDERPPSEIALSKLDELKMPDYQDFAQVKLFYSQLSDILRDYLAEQFEFPASKMTSDEITLALDNCQIKYELRQNLSVFLFDCDLVKFAKKVPTSEEIINAVREVRLFVAETSRKELSSGAEAISKGSQG